MVNWISAYIEHFTYAGLFVILSLCGLGLPMPEDVALLAGGFLAHKGITRYPYTLVVSLLGVIAGDNSLYFIGRGVGANLLRYFGLRKSPQPDDDSSNNMDRLHRFMLRHGHLAIFYARFFAGFRAIVYLSAGSLGVPPSRFFIYDLAGAAISVPIVVTLGYVFGEQIEQVIRYIGGFQKLIWLVAALSVAIYLTRMAVLRLSDNGAKP
ncbi:MAG TPA: DedA family protein [Candidatus Binataceae bacterium]|nr:DedA family protein [Candidatus Binataceae bacterium]